MCRLQNFWCISVCHLYPRESIRMYCILSYFLQVDLTANHSEIAKNGLRRLWGVPDTSAYVGHLFRMEIPKEAFSGEVLAYKVPIIVFVSSVCRGKSFAKFTSPQGSIAVYNVYKNLVHGHYVGRNL